MKVKEIKGLIHFIAKSGLDEVSIETEQIKLTVKKNMPIVQQIISDAPSSSAHVAAIQAISGPSEAVGSGPTHSPYVEFKSPMIGTFYKASDPDNPPFVQVGDQVREGQKLCVIEAMKLFNEIEADIAGTIIKVLVNDASPVEYDQPLFLIDPQSVLNKDK
jgi:acetyl-CoA carboxylase biotin carboxyl carrier protein